MYVADFSIVALRSAGFDHFENFQWDCQRFYCRFVKLSLTILKSFRGNSNVSISPLQIRLVLIMFMFHNVII